MDSMSNQYKKILQDLEKNIQNKQDLDYIKSQISSLFMVFFDEIDQMKELYEERVETILRKQKAVEDKLTIIEGSLNNIEKDIYIEEGSDFEIVCPYCNNEFVAEMDELKDEVECPECHNLIELDWNDDEETECGHHCSECDTEKRKQKTQQEDDDDDDM